MRRPWPTGGGLLRHGVGGGTHVQSLTTKVPEMTAFGENFQIQKLGQYETIHDKYPYWQDNRLLLLM